MRWRIASLVVVYATGCDHLFDIREIGSRDDSNPADMQHAMIAHTTGDAVANSTHVSSVTLPLPSPPAVGNLLVVALVTYQCVPTSVTDGSGNTYVKTPSSPVNSPYNSLSFWLAEVAATTDPFAVTATCAPNGPSPEVTFSVDGYTGLTPTILPLAEANAVTTSDAATLKCGSVTTGDEPQLLVAAMTHERAGAATPSSELKRLHEPVTDTTDTATLEVADATFMQSTTVAPSFTVTLASAGACALVLLH